MTTSIDFTDLGDGRTETVTHQTNVPEMYRSRRGPGRHADELRPHGRLPGHPLRLTPADTDPGARPRPARAGRRDVRRRPAADGRAGPGPRCGPLGVDGEAPAAGHHRRPATHTSVTSRLDADHTRCSIIWSSSSRGTKAGSSRSTAIMSALAPAARTPEVGASDGQARSPGGQVQGRSGREGGRIPLPDAGEHGGQTHLLPQVEVVVGRRAVGAQADPDPLGQELAPGAPPPRPAWRCSGGSGPPPRRGAGRRSMSSVGQPDAVGGQDPPSEHAGVGQHHRGRAPCSAANRMHSPSVSARWMWNRASSSRAEAAMSASTGRGTV